jgi:hypothetical protein
LSARLKNKAMATKVSPQDAKNKKLTAAATATKTTQDHQHRSRANHHHPLGNRFAGRWIIF